MTIALKKGKYYVCFACKNSHKIKFTNYNLKENETAGKEPFNKGEQTLKDELINEYLYLETMDQLKFVF